MKSSWVSDGYELNTKVFRDTSKFYLLLNLGWYLYEIPKNILNISQNFYYGPKSTKLGLRALKTSWNSLNTILMHKLS